METRRLFFKRLGVARDIRYLSFLFCFSRRFSPIYTPYLCPLYLARRESVRFASVRSRVRIPPSPPNQNSQSVRNGCFDLKEPKGDSNPSGSEWSAGGAPEPRGGLRRSGGRIPPSPPNKKDRQKPVLLFAIDEGNRTAFLQFRFVYD